MIRLVTPFLAGLLGLAVISPSPAAADPITYAGAFDITSPGEGSTGQFPGPIRASYRITTDGVVGALRASDILGFSFTLTANGETDSVGTGTGPADFVNQQGTFSATAQDILFDTSTAFDAFVLFNSAHTAAICWSTYTGACNGPAGTAAVLLSNGSVFVGPVLTGVVSIASAVPEPASLAVLGCGLIGLAVGRRRSPAAA